jgi:dTDP-L-rhamnose 4-epimerase
LLAHGYQVRVLDSLDNQVHGDGAKIPTYLSQDVEFIQGDIRDADKVRQALTGVSAVFHFAAAVGVGQSMYEIAHYTDVNNRGTAVLLEALIKEPVERLIVASSMSLYGEGCYCNSRGQQVAVTERRVDQLRTGHWELYDSSGEPLQPVPTSETKPAAPSSVYALSKYDQERMSLMVGQAYQIPTVALRFFNVYGSRQSLSNPYTGVLAIFSSRYLNDRRPVIFEDGLQRRDFVSVHDVALACRLALEKPAAVGQVLNVGSGKAVTIQEIAERTAQVLGKTQLAPEITGKYRVGDIRHCFADIDRARQVLDYQPRVSFEKGLQELAAWLQQQSAEDRVEAATAELVSRGLRL